MLYEVADAHGTTVGDLTGTRRRYSKVRLPERSAQALGLMGDESQDDDGLFEITIEHYDEGLSASELPFIRALWQIHKEEQDKGN